jgi:hypothetical protein
MRRILLHYPAKFHRKLGHGLSALRERPRQLLALTSLLPAEFDELLTDFAPAWERYHRYHTLDGANRRLPAHAERAKPRWQAATRSSFSCSST